MYVLIIVSNSHNLYFLSVVSDETEHGFNSRYAFIYSDIMVNISQVTPVTIQNKNHLEIIPIITFK